MKNIQSGTRTHLTDEHLKATLRIAALSIKPDTEALINKKFWKKLIWLLSLHKSFI
jgi:hypothetical protein